MTITVEATYANGVLRPDQPLPLAENEKVRVTVVQQAEALPSVTVEDIRPPIWERLVALTADAPADELAKPPIDGASQHDHYIYGTPKRADMPE